jgi:uncharacterized protein YggT (Ycf19 family)
VPFEEARNLAFALLVAQQLTLVAALALFGQLVVGIFNWRARENNLVYKLFQTVASPVVKVVRLVTPKVVIDRHIPIAAFMLLVFAYFWLGIAQRDSCRADLTQAGCDRWVEAWGTGGTKQ